MGFLLKYIDFLALIFSKRLSVGTLLFCLVLGINGNVVYSQCYEEIAISNGIEGNWGTLGEISNGGISFVDFTDDGYDDLSFASSTGNELYFFINEGTGVFKPKSLVSNLGQFMSILWVDYDNDSDKDFVHYLL